MNYYSSVRKVARSSLKGYWLRATVALLIWQGALAFFTFAAEIADTVTGHGTSDFVSYIITLAGMILGNIVVAPLELGFKDVMRRCVNSEQPSVAYVLKLFSSGKRLWRAYVMKTAKYIMTVLPLILLSIPDILTDMSSDIFSFPGLPGFVSDIIPWVSESLAFISVIISVYMFCGFFAADFIFLEDEDVSAFQALRRSLIMSHGNRKYILGHIIRFIPWLLLSLTGFGMLYSMPYFWASSAVFVHDMCKNEVSVSSDAPLGDTAVFDPVGNADAQ